MSWAGTARHRNGLKRGFWGREGLGLLNWWWLFTAPNVQYWCRFLGSSVPYHTTRQELPFSPARHQTFKVGKGFLESHGNIMQRERPDLSSFRLPTSSDIASRPRK